MRRRLDKLTRIKTKIIATLGPASQSPEVLAELLDAGMDVCRLNFSHGTLEDHGRVLATIRRLATQRDLAITIIGDLCGPKIRLGECPKDGVELSTGAVVRITRGQAPCDAAALTTTHPDLIDDADVGQRVLIDDGLVRLLVTDKEPDALVCACTTGGRVFSRKGLNLPDTRISLPSLTDKDRRDLDWAIDNELDYVALSFVRRPEDLAELKRLIKQRDGDLRVIIKIEKPEALQHLDELVANSDGVLVARGDLGVEMDAWQVPLIQKDLTARCREAGVPVIIATQMLQSMVSNPTPTRAEVSDVANAIFDAADAIMLSAETAIGQHAVLAVDMMNRVADVTEKYLVEHPPAAHRTPHPAGLKVTNAIAAAAAQAAVQLNARLVAVWTAAGNAARLIAKQRLPVPVVGLTWQPKVARRINLMYGIVPLHLEPIPEPERMFAALDERLIKLGLAEKGDLIIVITATRPHQPGGTNALLVHNVGDVSGRSID